MNCNKCPIQKHILELPGICKNCKERHEDPNGSKELLCAGTCPRYVELRNACLNCANGAESAGLNGGDVHVNFESGVDALNFGTVRVAGDYVAGCRKQQSRFLESAPDGVGDYLMALVSAFSALELADVELLHCLLNDMSCADIARALGFKGRAVVHARLKRALARNPWLAALCGRNLGIVGKRVRLSPTWRDWDGKMLMRKSGSTYTPIISTVLAGAHTLEGLPSVGGAKPPEADQ